MSLKATFSMFLQLIFILIMIPIGFIVHFCQIFMSFAEKSTHFLENLQDTITISIKRFTLLLLKIVTTISTSIQNCIFEICDILARATLNSNEQILLKDNSKNSLSFPAKYSATNGNRDVTQNCFGNCNHVVKNAIFISNLPCNRSVTMMLDPNEIETDKQDSTEISFSKLFPNYCSNSKTNDAGKVSGKDFNNAFEKTENQTLPSMKDDPKSPMASEMISTKDSTVNVEHSTLADNLDQKEKAFIENTEYPLKRSTETCKHSCDSSNTVLEKQLIESKNVSLDNEIKTIINERNIVSNEHKFPLFDKEELEKMVKKEGLKLLYRHRLISKDSLSDDSSEKSTSCDSIIEACSTSLISKTKTKSSNSSEDLNIENSFGNNFPTSIYCPKHEKSDSVLKDNIKNYSEIALGNVCAPFNTFDAENVNKIQETKPSMYIDDAKSGVKTVFKNQNPIEKFPMKNAYAKSLHCKNVYNNEFGNIVKRMPYDSRKVGSNETISEKFNGELTNQSIENTKEDETFEVIESDMDKLLTFEENKFYSFSTKDIATGSCSWKHNDIIKNVGEKLISLNSLETKARNYYFKDAETGEISSFTSPETSMHRTLPSERQSTEFPKKSLTNSVLLVQENMDGLSSGNSLCFICDNHLENILDMPANSVSNYALHPDVKTEKNIENKETIMNGTDSPLDDFYHDSYECGTDTKKNDKILKADERVKLLSILQSLYPDGSFELDAEITCKDNIRKSELIKIFYKNKLEIDNKISLMLETFENLKSMTVEEYNRAMRQMLENSNYQQNEENMLECVNLYLFGPTYLEES